MSLDFSWLCENETKTNRKIIAQRCMDMDEIALYEWGASATAITLIVVSSFWHKKMRHLSYLMFLITG
jgi:hypothetical protein